jgi:hypothetical protein
MMFSHPSALEKCSSNSCLCWRMEIHMFANVHSRCILLLCSTVSSQLLYMSGGWPSIRWRPHIHLLGQDIVQSSFYAGGWRLGCTPMCTWNEYSSYGTWLAPILLYTLGELTIEKMMSVHPSALAKHSSNSCLCWRMEIHMFANVHSRCILLLCSTVSSLLLYMCGGLTINQMMSTHPSSRARHCSKFFLCWRMKTRMYANVYSKWA